MGGGGGGTRTLTLVFTDVEGSTRALQTVGDHAYSDLIDVHLRLVRDALAAHGGVDVQTEGDAVFFAFDSAAAALRGAVDAQFALSAHDWPEGAELFARVGVHTGDVVLAGANIRGITVHQTARICASAHGGQILVSTSAAASAGPALSEQVQLRELGHFRLKDLSEPVSLLQAVAPGLRTEFPPPRTLDVHAHNLPIQVTPLVGRVRELEQLRQLVVAPAVRLVSMTGPGGIGKTRLGVQIAAEVASSFADGVWFVDLEPLRDPALVPTAILAALGADDRPELSDLDEVIDHLKAREALLVLDNFEHLLSAAEIVSKLIASCPRLSILVTTRTLLRIRGEHEFPVPPMDIETEAIEGEAGSDATALFVQSAIAVDPSFTLNDANTSAIRDICARVDGLPLAIELAASRTKFMSPVAILERLETRLDVLASDKVDVPERQRNLQGTIAWSYDLLNDVERRALRRMSVFRGGCSIDAAEAVCGPADAIGALVDRSLVRRTTSSEGDVRFTLLDTIGRFAADELDRDGDADDAARAHAEWFARWAGRAARELRGSDQALWLDRIGRDIDNVRAVIAWGASPTGEPRMVLGTVVDLGRFWTIRGRVDEAVPILERLVETVVEPCAERARGLLLLGELEVESQQLSMLRTDVADRIYPMFDEAARIARGLGDDALLAHALLKLAIASHRRTGSKRRHYEPIFAEARELARRMGDEDLEIEIRSFEPRRGLRALFDVSQIEGSYLADERIAAARARGDRAAVAEVQLARFSRAWADVTGEQAREIEEVVRTARELGNVRLLGRAHLVLARAARTVTFDDRAANDHLLAARAAFDEIGERRGRVRADEELADLARSVGDREAVRRIAAARSGDWGYRAGAAIAMMFGASAYAPGPAVVGAALAWVVAPVVWGITPVVLGLLAVSGWVLSGFVRSQIQWLRRLERSSGSLSFFTFTALTLVSFILAFAIDRPWIGAAIVSLVAIWRIAVARGLAGAPRRRATCLLVATVAFTVAAAEPLLPGATVEVASAASYFAFAAVFGFNAKPASLILRVAQAGWFLVRFGWPVFASSALAAHRGVDTDAWYGASAFAVSVGIVFFAAAVVVRGPRMWPAGLLIGAGAAILGYTLRQQGELAVVGCVVFGVGFFLLSLAPIVFRIPPLMRIRLPDDAADRSPRP